MESKLISRRGVTRLKTGNERLVAGKPARNRAKLLLAFTREGRTSGTGGLAVRGNLLGRLTNYGAQSETCSHRARAHWLPYNRRCNQNVTKIRFAGIWSIRIKRLGEGAALLFAAIDQHHPPQQIQPLFFFKYYDEYSAAARPQGRSIVFGGSWTFGGPPKSVAMPTHESSETRTAK